MTRIVVGVDGSEAGEAALRFAVAEARLRGAPLEAVIAWHEPYVAPTLAPVVPDPTVFADAAARTLDQSVEAAVAGGDPIEVKRVVKRGGAAEVLLEQADGADLLIVGSRGRGGFAGLLLGSVSQQVVHHATCPVVVVPEPSS
jgi:nucleotide-binding universal stress UspA family protein